MADERTYYVICADNCKFESMTKEQILAAIEQAVSTGEIKNVDTGFVTRLREQNANRALTFWVGTTAQYNALTEKAENCFYILTDDTTAEDINRTVEEIKIAMEEVEQKVKTDYVIEQGKTVIYTNEAKTAGVVWEYRKWESGVLECWGSYEGNHDLTEVNLNGFYSSSIINLNFPFTFSSYPNVVLSGYNNSAYGATHFPVLCGAYKDYAAFKLSGLESKESLKNSKVYLYLNVKGRWK